MKKLMWVIVALFISLTLALPVFAQGGGRVIFGETSFWNQATPSAATWPSWVGRLPWRRIAWCGGMWPFWAAVHL